MASESTVRPNQQLDADALDFHMRPVPGKLGVAPTKPMAT
jgi:hypothetical protein